jgi:hypothetical protein
MQVCLLVIIAPHVWRWSSTGLKSSFMVECFAIYVDGCIFLTSNYIWTCVQGESKMKEHGWLGNGSKCNTPKWYKLIQDPFVLYSRNIFWISTVVRRAPGFLTHPQLLLVVTTNLKNSSISSFNVWISTLWTVKLSTWKYGPNTH